MRKIFLIFFLICFYLCSVFSQSVKVFNNSRIVPTNGNYWVIDNGHFVVAGDNNNNIVFENLIITENASVEVTSQSNLTINDSLNMGAGLSKLILKSDINGTASLITNGYLNGRSTMEKFLSASSPSGWTVSSAVKNAPQHIFENHIGTFYFNPLIVDWQAFASGNMEVVRGYWTKFANDKVLLFNDTLNTGTITYTNFYRTAPYGSGNMGWNFIGNPYASALAWDEIVAQHGGTHDFKSTTKLNNAIYVLKPDGSGSYFHYVDFIGTGNPPFNGVIPAATSFWVQVNKDYHDINNPTVPVQGAHLTLNNSQRVHERLQPGSKNKQSGIIRIYVENDMHQDDIILRLRQGATLGFDPAYDAFKMQSEDAGQTQLYMFNNTDKIAINSIPDDVQLPASFPIGVKTQSNKLQTIHVNLSDFEHDEISVHLEDKVKNTLVDIRLQDVYSYISLNNIEEQRFVLHLGLAETATNNNLTDNNVNVYSYENSVYISNMKESTVFSLYNMLGQLIYSEVINDVSFSKEFYLPKAYYIVKLSGNNTHEVKKVFISTNYY